MDNTAAYNQLDKSEGDNYLTPDQQKAYQQALRDCGSDNRCQVQVARVYETLDDRQEIERRVAQIQQVGDNIATGAQNLYDAVTSPVQTVKDLVSGIGNLTPEAVADGLKQAADSQHQNHVDRAEAYVAGDSQALGQAEGNIATENLGALGLPGGIGVAGKVADAATDVLDASKAGKAVSWPPNRGFDDDMAPATLIPGARIDRYGSPDGTFVAPEGTPFPMRSLPDSAVSKPLNSYEVVRPIEVDAGSAMPWFNQPGGGVQFELPGTVRELIDSGNLREVK